MRRLIGYQLIVVVILNIVGLSAMAGCSKKVKKVQVFPVFVEAPNSPVTALQEKEVVAEPEAEPVNPAPTASIVVSVYFDFESCKLLPQEAMKMDYLLGQGLEFRIVGHACTLGTNDWNMGLSVERGNRIAEYLGSGEVVGLGEEFCDAPCRRVYAGECQKCRRVDIYLK